MLLPLVIHLDIYEINKSLNQLVLFRDIDKTRDKRLYLGID